ncbi:hypothetical protein [Mangrovicoccus sp. HB161399]|nr:hypothetical protein [Mangrovicoccus sp. HB161399]
MPASQGATRWKTPTIQLGGSFGFDAADLDDGLGEIGADRGNLRRE